MRQHSPSWCTRVGTGAAVPTRVQIGFPLSFKNINVTDSAGLATTIQTQSGALAGHWVTCTGKVAVGTIAKNIQIQATAPATPGTFNVVATVDATGNSPDANQSNNSDTMTFRVQ